MCDTMVTVTDDGVLFAKNSDRDPNEAQVLEWVPAIDHTSGEPARLTWIEVPQVARTRAVLLSRPWWMWGAEMGANDAGVVIGNEAVFTKGRYGDRALLGMDLVRLGLERGGTKEEAVGVMVELLEEHGQGGPCSHDHPRFTYDNSFIVADPLGAIVLETAGRAWATEEVRSGARSISNGLTIEPFASQHADRLRGAVAACSARRALTQSGAAGATTPADLMALLRSHGDGPLPRWSPANGAMAAPCMHAGGLIAGSQTTASWVADLRGATRRHWVTATAAPCTSIFKPVTVDAPCALAAGPEPPTNRYDPTVPWWRHEQVHRAVLRDPGALLPRLTPERDRIERAWLAAPPTSDEAFAESARLDARWSEELAEVRRADRRPAVQRALWRRLDAAAGMPTVSDQRFVGVPS